MKHAVLNALIAIAACLSAHAASFGVNAASGAAEYTLDLTCAVPLSSQAPVIRRAKMDVSSLPTASPSLAVGDRISLRLFNDVAFDLEIVFIPPSGIAGQSFIARDKNGSASAVIKPTNAGWRITIDDFKNARMYTIRSKGGIATLTESDTTPAMPDECGTCCGQAGTSGASKEESPAGKKRVIKAAAARLLGDSAGDFAFAEHTNIVDILVVFDRGAKAWALEGKGTGENSSWIWDSVEECAESAVARMNMVVANSRNDDKYAFRLVGVTEVDASYDNIDATLLNRVSNGYAPFSNIPAIGASHGADVVVTFVNVDENRSSFTTGMAWGLEYGITQEHLDDYVNQYGCGYAVCHIARSFREYTMAHEVGHTMGAGHSNMNENFDRPQTVDYSCGYHFMSGGTRYRTIMGYNRSKLDNGTKIWQAAPYFSEPAIPTNEYGVAVYEVPIGTAISNDNRRVLRETCEGVSRYRDRVMPYDWDVRFLDANGKELLDGDFLAYGIHGITLSNANENAEIYYTLDDTTPSWNSPHVSSGSKLSVSINGSTVISACAVVDGIAQSIRRITIKEGTAWSGESGMNGNGIWSLDSSVLAWDNCSTAFDRWTSVVFPDNIGGQAPVVTVVGEVAPYSSAFPATATAYTFAKGSDNALITLRDSSFAPSGDLTFNVPVSLAAANFTSPGGHSVTFNAPFGTNVAANASYGHCTNMIVVGESGTLTVAPGAGKTQVFDRFNNIGTYWNTATFKVGEGTVRFKGPINGGHGVFGSTKVSVGNGGNLVFDIGSALGMTMSSPVTIAEGGSITFNADMEILHRPLTLDGGTVYCANRFDWYDGLTIHATGNSAIEDLNGNAYVLIRFNDSTVNVADNKILALNIKILDGYNTSGCGLIKTGRGEFVANKLLAHSGATVVSNGIFTVGYSSSTAYGTGWTVCTGATLRVKQGCAVALPSLSLESGAAVCVPAAESAPLTASGEVNVAHVRLRLVGAAEFSEGSTYPLVKSNTGITGVADARTDDLPELGDGLVWKLTESGGILSARVAAAQAETTLNIPKGESVNLGDVADSIETITGEGTLVCGATLPGKGYGLTNDSWRGTVAFSGFNNQTALNDFQCELYGNANSKIQFTNCKIPYLKGNDATFAGAIVLVGDDALVTKNGYSEHYNIFGALEGTGSMSFTDRPKQGYVFNTATNFSGSITVNEGYYASNPQGRRIVFGTVSKIADLPDVSASITIQSDATASIGGGATWYAYHGVEIAGTLLVKGANATLDCNASAATGLKIDDGSTLCFETADASLVFAKAASFASGTNHIAFASGLAPTNGMCLLSWPSGSPAPAGDFAFADATLAAKWSLRKTAGGLVVENAPMPQTVPVSISLRYWGDNGWEDRALGFELPSQWATNHYPSLDTAEAVAAKYNETAANGAAVWQCYMLGLDPTDASSKVSLAMAIENGEIHFTINGLGETHAIDGITVYWSLRTSTDLVTDSKFSKTRESTTGLSPKFPAHSIPDKATASAATTSDKLFYKIIVTFVAE